MTIFANTTGPKTVRSAFYKYMEGAYKIKLASPYFSYSDLIKDIGTPDRDINLLVRLGAATSPYELRKVFFLPNVNIRFFTSAQFHSKLYIFGDNHALIGSANLTQSGVQTNREVVVAIPRENRDFDELVSLFESYWAEAKVLDENSLEQYAKLYDQQSPQKSSEADFEKEIQKKFGDIAPSQGIQVGLKKPSREKLHLEDYRRTYQEFLMAFRELESIYQQDGRRQQAALPLRIEIDQFLNYLRGKHCPSDSYQDAPLRNGEERKVFVKELIDEWFQIRWKYLDEHIVLAFPKIQSQLGNPESIQNSDMDQLIDALEICHAFHDQLRFHRDGEPTLRRQFAKNGLSRVKKTLTYLLHGRDDFIERMGNVIFNPSLKLEMIGRSVSQELLGWVNEENIPICNERTLKVLRFLGYDL